MSVRVVVRLNRSTHGVVTAEVTINHDVYLPYDVAKLPIDLYLGLLAELPEPEPEDVHAEPSFENTHRLVASTRCVEMPDGTTAAGVLP